MKSIDMKTTKHNTGFMRALIYGEAGCGKTHLLREFPTPMLIFDFDQKYEPLIGVDGIEVKSYTIQNLDIASKSYETLRKEFWADWKEATKRADLATICIDSLTNLDSLLIKACMEMSNKTAESKVTIPIYGDLKNFYGTLLSSMRGLSQRMHVVVLAHEKFFTNDEGSIISIKPLCTGGTRDELCAQFKDTWYYEYKRSSGDKEERTLYYKKFAKHVCASTTLRGEGKIIDPTFEKIQAVINKGEGNA